MRRVALSVGARQGARISGSGLIANPTRCMGSRSKGIDAPEGGARAAHTPPPSSTSHSSIGDDPANGHASQAVPKHEDEEDAYSSSSWATSGVSSKARLLSALGQCLPGSAADGEEVEAERKLDADEVAKRTFLSKLGPGAYQVNRHGWNRCIVTFFPLVLKVLAGKKELLDENDSFKFTCTACGQCCHSYANTVMLYPYDIFLMSRAPGLRYRARRQSLDKPALNPEDSGETPPAAIEIDRPSTSLLYALYPKAFRFVLGTIRRVDTEVVIPVCLMKAKNTKPNKSGKPNDRDYVCYFAYEAIESDTSDSKRFLSYSEYLTKKGLIQSPPELPNRKTKTEGRQARLRCSLGPEHMPTPCAIYPLGELYTPQIIPAPKDKHFYSLDSRKRCEGLTINDAPRRDVSEYLQGLDMRSKQIEAQWFLNMAQRCGRGNIFEDLRRMDSNGQSLEIVYNLFRSVWYEFDTLPGAATEQPPRRDIPSTNVSRAQLAAEWEVIKQRIEEQSEAICDDLRTCLQSVDHQQTKGKDDVSRPRLSSRLSSRLRLRGSTGAKAKDDHQARNDFAQGFDRFLMRMSKLRLLDYSVLAEEEVKGDST
jgi:hypothetical protein